MDLLENEDCKKSFISLEDFPFICRICCLKRRNLKLFQEENYLFDLFHTVRKIDVHSTAQFPKNVCSGCLKELECISLFIDASKGNIDASLGKNMPPKKEHIECTDGIESGFSRTSVEKLESEENGEDICYQGSQICRICSASSLTQFEEKMHLIHLFENITYNVKAEFSDSKMNNSICNNCTDELERISSFVTSSLHNDQKLEDAIARNMSVKTEIYSNSIDVEFSTLQEFKLESVIGKNEVLATNTDEEFFLFYETDVKPEYIDIKEEIIDHELVTSDGNELVSSTDNEVLLITGSVKNPFICDYCRKGFANEWYLKQHLLIHSGKRQPFRCDRCEKEFSSKQHFKQHMITHTEKNVFKCECCEKIFKHKHSLKNHMLTHSGEKSFKCDCCEKSYYKQTNLKQHMLTHIETFKCDCCEKIFKHKYSLKTHMLTHSGEKPFKCDICEKCFARKSVLKVHMLTHTGEKRFECVSCGKFFRRRFYLQQHMLIHNKEKPFKCEICERSFRKKTSLQAHMLARIGPKLCKCKCCDEKFVTKPGLAEHNDMLNHSDEKSFRCDDCGKCFDRKCKFQRHMIIHNREKPFKCDTCDKCFSRKYSLKEHMLIHTGETFKCQSCEKSYSRNFELQKHMLSHTGEKLFECDICKKCFSQKIYLQRHMVNHIGKNHSNHHNPRSNRQYRSS